MSKCNKKSYVYYNVAKMALRKIHANPKPIKGDRLPIDIYLCPRCGAYHLTGMTREEYRELQNQKIRNLMKIEFEAEEICTFQTFSTWVNKGSSWLSGFKRFKGDESQKIVCIDKNGNACNVGEDFMAAEKADLFPVKAYRLIRTIDVVKSKTDV